MGGVGCKVDSRFWRVTSIPGLIEDPPRQEEEAGSDRIGLSLTQTGPQQITTHVARAQLQRRSEKRRKSRRGDAESMHNRGLSEVFCCC
jgi:hypothetical protein